MKEVVLKETFHTELKHCLSTGNNSPLKTAENIVMKIDSRYYSDSIFIYIRDALAAVDQNILLVSYYGIIGIANN